MKYLKTFEYEYYGGDDVIKNFASYVIDNSKLQKYTDGFIDYSIQDYKKNTKYYTYYFKFDLEMFGDYKIGVNRLVSFLKSIDAKSINPKKMKHIIEVSFEIERDSAREIAELYMSINKYNL